MVPIIEHIRRSIDEYDLEKMNYLLSHIRQSHYICTYFHHNMDFADALENFLFSIPNESSQQKEREQNIRLFLSIINPSLVFPSLMLRHEHDVDLTILHNLCMEGRHEALRMLLSEVDPHIASYEVRRLAWLDVDYMDNKGNIHQSENYRTPMHAAWNGMLFERDIEEYLTKVHLPSDLDDDFANVWNTSVYLLQAFDGKALDLSLNDTADWNILHAMIRYGYGGHAALIFLALKFYPNLARVFDRDGNLALHLAAKQQIFYRSQKPSHDEKRSSFNSKDNENLRLFPNDACKLVPMDIDLDMDTDIDNGRTTPVDTPAYDEPTISMILATCPSAASISDRDGRLPLHLVLMYHEENEALLDSIDEMTMDGFHAARPSNGYQMDTLNVVKAMVEANPHSLDCFEPSSGLPPFMLAASGKRMPLDIIYTLLSENPTVLEAFME